MAAATALQAKPDAHPLRVTVVMPLGEQRGGAERALINLLEEGRESGVTWQVVFLEDGPLVAQAEALGVEACVLAAAPLNAPHRWAVNVARLAAILRRQRADVVLGWMTKAHLYGGAAALLARIPAVWFQHGLASPEDRIDRMAIRVPARGILVCSQFAAERQAVLQPRCPLRVVHPGAEIERFDPATLPAPALMRAQLGLPADGPLIGMVGRLQRWKGMHTLIEAMPALLRQHPGAHAVLVGGAHDDEPDYPAYVEGRIAALGLEKRVVLAGLQHNVAEWMQASDVMVHASFQEPFGIVIVEAMALGKPVVAGGEGGPKEIIAPGKTGLLTPFEDAPALAHAVSSYLEDTDFAACIGAAARERAQAFSTRRYAHNVIATLRELLAK